MTGIEALNFLSSSAQNGGGNWCINDMVYTVQDLQNIILKDLEKADISDILKRKVVNLREVGWFAIDYEDFVSRERLKKTPSEFILTQEEYNRIKEWISRND